MQLLLIITAISAALVLISRNIVYSLAFLVTTFFFSALALIQSGLEFLGYALIVVYVGAVAILFLFVVMTLDVGQEEAHYSRVRNAGGYHSHLVALAFALFIFWSINAAGAPVDGMLSRYHFVSDLWTASVSSGGAGAVALTLYTHNFMYLLLAGFLLLVAMVGGVSLALPPVRPSQKSYAQSHRLPGKAVTRSRSRSGAP